MKTLQDFITPDDFPDWTYAFDGEVSYPLTKRFRGPLLSRGATGWLSDLVTKDLYNSLKLCQAADSTEHYRAESWLRALALAHAVGAAEAQA